jgi:hypothetical protein
MNNYNSLRPHMVHFARLRSQYRPAYVNWLIGYALRTSDGWNRLMALIYAQ